MGARKSWILSAFHDWFSNLYHLQSWWYQVNYLPYGTRSQQSRYDSISASFSTLCHIYVETKTQVSHFLCLWSRTFLLTTKNRTLTFLPRQGKNKKWNNLMNSFILYNFLGMVGVRMDRAMDGREKHTIPDTCLTARFNFERSENWAIKIFVHKIEWTWQLMCTILFSIQ